MVMTIKPQPFKSHARITRATKPAVRPAPEVCAYPVRRFTVDEYHRMIDAGILGEDDRVELINGWIIATVPKNPPHEVTMRRTELQLREVIPEGWWLDIRKQITTSVSEPEPDFTVVVGNPDRYANRHPGYGDIALVVEVADTSVIFDQTTKRDLYAQTRLPIYWIVNIADRQVEVYADPGGPARKRRYRSTTIFVPGQQVPVVIDGRTVGQVPVSSLLPA